MLISSSAVYDLLTIVGVSNLSKEQLKLLLEWTDRNKGRKGELYGKVAEQVYLFWDNIVEVHGLEVVQGYDLTDRIINYRKEEKKCDKVER